MCSHNHKDYDYFFYFFFFIETNSVTRTVLPLASIMIITHFKFSHIFGPARNVRKNSSFTVCKLTKQGKKNHGVPTDLEADLLGEVGHTVEHLDALLDALVDDGEVVEGLLTHLLGLGRVGVPQVLVVVHGVHAVLLLRLNVVLQGLQDHSGLREGFFKSVKICENMYAFSGMPVIENQFRGKSKYSIKGLLCF